MRTKKGIAVGIVAVFIFIGLIAGFGLSVLRNADRLSESPVAEEDYSSYYGYALPTDLGDWECFSHQNAPSAVRFIPGSEHATGADVFYYELNCEKEEFYSMDASITSPCLQIADADYLLNIDYYTHIRTETPNTLTVLSSVDGTRFTEVASFECKSTTGPVFKNLTVELTEPFRYLRFTFYVYYAGDLTDSGLGIRADTLKLYTKQKELLTENQFDITFDTEGSTPENGFPTYIYNGSEQHPTPIVRTKDDAVQSDDYYYTLCLQQGETAVASSVHVGTYSVAVEVYNAANTLCFTSPKTYFKINKATIFVKDGSEKYIYNNNYFILYGLAFEDGNGRTVPSEELSGYFSPIFKRTDNADDKFTLRLSLPENSDYLFTETTFTPEINTTGESPVGALFRIDGSIDGTVRRTYDGEPVDILSDATYFRDDPSSPVTKPDQYCTVTYLLDGEETDAAVRAGTYTVTVTVPSLGNQKAVFTLVIDPCEIEYFTYNGSDLVKKYDGTVDLFDGETGKTVLSVDNTYLECSVATFGGDAVTVECEQAVYGRAIGDTYIRFLHPYLSGVDADNYTLADNFRVETKSGVRVCVEKTVAVLSSDKDGMGETISVADKTYTPNNTTAEYNIAAYRQKYGESVTEEEYLAISLPVYGESKIRYSDVTFSFLRPDVGTQELAVRVTNETLYDRYEAEALTAVKLYGTIVPRPLTVDALSAATVVTGRDKEYDGTSSATPTVQKLDFTETVDGFPAEGSYRIEYTKAFYASSDAASDRLLTLQGVRYVGLTATAVAFFKNYRVSDFSVTGNITPAEMEIYTEYIRINARQDLPILKSNADDADIKKRLYLSKSDAETGNGNTSSPTQTTVNKYWLRVESSSTNYSVLGGYKLIPVDVVNNQKIRQKILLRNLDISGGKTFAMQVGGSFTPDAVSATESEINNAHRLTDLSVRMTVNDANGCVSVQNGTFTVCKAGTFSFTLSQSGNDFYYSADPITVTVNAVSSTLQGALTDEIDSGYVGSSLPSLENKWQVRDGDEVRTGTLLPSDEKLSSEQEKYTYYYTADAYIDSFTADYSMNGTYYVADGSEFVVADASYNSNLTYYRRVYRTAAVTADATVSGLYYEKNYVLTSDSIFSGTKDYYTASYTVASGTADKASKVIPKNTYYEKREGEYRVSSDTVFTVNTYYTVSYVLADDIAEGDSLIYGTFYEKVDEAYTLTEDTEAQPLTEYYRLAYTVADVVAGSAVPEDKTYYTKDEDSYFLTEDAVFQADKTYYYYRYVYTAIDAGNIGSTVPANTYYEIGEEYFLTTDDTFRAEQTYYVAEYEQVYFILAGTRINKERYFEQGEGDTYLTVGEDTFTAGKTYYHTVWQPSVTVASDPVPAGTYYERSALSYALTEDTVYQAGKKYYRILYTAQSVTAGDSVPENTYYEKNKGKYALTEDTVFVADKTYYTSSFTRAVVTVGADVLENTHYEQTAYTYSLTADTVFNGAKTYYVMVYEKAVFLKNARTLPNNATYYTVADKYSKTADSRFAPDTVYYSGIYTAASVENGTVIDGTYYEYKGGTYAVTTDRFFDGRKTYYQIACTEYDSLALRTVDAFNTYYILAEGNYADGETYYLKNGNTFVEDAVTVGNPTDGNHYQKLQDDEFIQGKEYFFHTYYFIGDYPIEMPIPVQKASYGLQTTAVTVISYTDELDLYTVIESVTVTDGEGVRLADYESALSYLKEHSDLTLYHNIIQEDGTYEREAFSAGALPASDTIYAVLIGSPNDYLNAISPNATQATIQDALTELAECYSWELTERSSDYILNTGDGYFGIKVNKKDVVLSLTAYSKYYAEEMPTEAELLNNCLSSDSELPDGIEEILSVTVQAYDFSDIGAYPTELAVRSDLSVGDTVPAYYEYDAVKEGYTVTADNTFAADKTYYQRSFVSGFFPTIYVKNGNNYRLTEDTFYQNDTVYYAYKYNKAASVTFYYTKEEDAYLRVKGGTFAEDTVYYTYDGESYHTAAVTVGDDVPKYYGMDVARGYKEATEESVYPKKVYYERAYSEIGFTVGAPIRKTYQIKNGVYTATDDDLPYRLPEKCAKQYYILAVCDAERPNGFTIATVTAGEKIPTYYLKNGENYSAVDGGIFTENTDYYTYDFLPVAVVVGETVPAGEYFVEKDGVYMMPSDETFRENTQYYQRGFSLFRPKTLNADTLSASYNFSFRSSYVTVNKVRVSVTLRKGETVTAEYGQAYSAPDLAVKILAEGNFSASGTSALEKSILEHAVVSCPTVDGNEKSGQKTDCGEYVLMIQYSGDNSNVDVVCDNGCSLRILPATLPKEDFSFEDNTVLYDGKIYTLTVELDEDAQSRWADAVITYDKEGFSEVGSYDFTATVSLKNYEDLSLHATLTIGTATLQSVNRVNNAVSVTVTDPSCTKGVSGTLRTQLHQYSADETVPSFTANLTNSGKTYSSTIFYRVDIYDGSSLSSLGYSRYSVTVKPNDVVYSDNLEVWGLKNGSYQKLNFTYENGYFTFEVSGSGGSTENPLDGIAFTVSEKEGAQIIQYAWIIAGIAAALVVAMLGIVFGALKGNGAKRERSRKQHHRWV